MQITGVRGNGWAGDIAIDDIVLTAEYCSDCVGARADLCNVVPATPSNSATNEEMLCPQHFTAHPSKAGICIMQESTQDCLDWSQPDSRCDPRNYRFPSGDRWLNRNWAVPAVGTPTTTGTTIIWHGGRWETNGIPLSHASSLCTRKGLSLAASRGSSPKGAHGTGSVLPVILSVVAALLLGGAVGIYVRRRSAAVPLTNDNQPEGESVNEVSTSPYTKALPNAGDRGAKSKPSEIMIDV